MSLSIVEAMEDRNLFQPWFPGETWAGWKAILKAAFALPMSADEMAFFRQVAERDPPASPLKELWFIVGRRGGKDSIASVLAAHAAALFNDGGRLRPGERALVLCLAVDRDQSKIVLNYTRSYFRDVGLLRGMVQNETANGFELDNRVDIAVATNSFRSVRGRSILCAVLDETAFWRDDSSAVPDFETYNALKPGLASLPGSLLIGISSPYRRAGLLYKKFKEHYGKPSDDVLVIKAPTRALNPTIPQAIVDEAMADDPAAARAEWLAEFRDDLADFISHDAVMACVDVGVRERPPELGKHRYFSFTDPSGGSADSMTCAIGHREGEMIVVDCLREIPSPFDPESAADEFSALFKTYRMTMTQGDRYAAQWVAQAFEKRGIQYRQSELAKSDLYRNLLPHLNGKTIRLLDHQRSINQIATLERRTARGGKDSIDHPAQGRDDCANALAGLTYVVVDRHRPADSIMSDGFWPDGSRRWFNITKQEYIRPAGKPPPIATYNSASAPCTLDFSKINAPPRGDRDGFPAGQTWRK
jgi:hypothetical protein